MIRGCSLMNSEKYLEMVFLDYEISSGKLGFPMNSFVILEGYQA